AAQRLPPLRRALPRPIDPCTAQIGRREEMGRNPMRILSPPQLRRSSYSPDSRAAPEGLSPHDSERELNVPARLARFLFRIGQGGPRLPVLDSLWGDDLHWRQPAVGVRTTTGISRLVFVWYAS